MYVAINPKGNDTGDYWVTAPTIEALKKKLMDPDYEPYNNGNISLVDFLEDIKIYRLSDSSFAISVQPLALKIYELPPVTDKKPPGAGNSDHKW